MKLLLPAVFFSVGSAFVVPSPQPVSSSLKVASDLFVDETRASVSKYYGEELKGSDDLKTNACCTGVKPPTYIQQCISNIHPEVVAKYYGCGLCLPQYPLEGANVLDLGSGSGRDVYIASQLVGPTGKVSRKRVDRILLDSNTLCEKRFHSSNLFLWMSSQHQLTNFRFCTFR